MADKGEKSVKFALKAKQTIKRILRMIKFFATPLGTILGWILFILFAVLLLYVVVETVATSFKDLLGINTNYSTYEADSEVLNGFASILKIKEDIYASGYSSQLNPNDYIDYKAFEYAVLMDAAEYMRLNGQEKFDVAKNQGIYVKERSLLAKLIKEAEEERTKANPNKNRKPVVSLLSTTSETDQSVVEGDDLKNAIAQGNELRNINVVNFTNQGLNADKTTRGGNNRVTGPFLVYEFVYNGIKTDSGDDLASYLGFASGDTSNSGSDDSSNSHSGDVDSESGDNKSKFVEETSTAEDLFNNNQLGGSLVPYIYIVREEIDFSYYFNANNEALEIPFLLNAYNSELSAGVERSKEIMRATKGVAARVWPDLNMDKENGDYTWVPYYTDETNCTIYKIPLKTLIGRYMPRTELLYAWTMLKKNIDQGSSGTSDDKSLELGEEVVTKIKQIYNDACLKGELTKKIEKNVKNPQSGDRQNVQYECDDSNKSSFVTFEKAGIETTLYGEFEDVDSDTVKYISDFVSAYVISDRVTLYQTTESDAEIGYRISMEDLKVPRVSHGKVLRAAGDKDEGYVPASNLTATEEVYYYYGGEGAEEKIKSEILTAACRRMDIPNDDRVSISVDIEYSPIFIVSTTNYTKVLKIEHRRMPILLVKSAITWSREIEYSHAITQNLFEQTDHSYLVPKCVSSMGMQSFVTSEMKSNYRTKAYEDVFKILQEKDVISMLLSLETYAEKGNSDCYEYMRELYKLVKATQDYSQTSKKEINPDTYTYVYMQDSILYYDDKQTQKIYWLELLGQRGTQDALNKEEVESMRTRDPVLKWQILEYEKYDECEGRVYALNPFGSAYVRAYVQLVLDRGFNYLVNGSYEAGSHEGADLTGRSVIDSMLYTKTDITQGTLMARMVYGYSLKQLTKIYGGNVGKATEYLKTQLTEQVSNMPIVAVAPGKVRSVGYTGRSGFYVTIIHDEAATVKTIYCHLKRWPNVNVGDHVGAGTVIGYEGNTGRSTGTHLHFQISMSNAESGQRLDSPDETDDIDNHESLISGTVNPVDYIYPTFTPFYYYDKAKEDKFELNSEYMTLYRTVFLMDDDGTGNKAIGGSSVKNSVPKTPLLNDYKNLVQDQGKRERVLSMSGDLGWAETERADLYLREEYFNIGKARKAGFLAMDPDLLSILYGYIPVKTDMPAGLPALTREELEYILQHWLSKRYKKEEFDWLMENVFTEETIVKILEAQEEYKVSAVFALAVGTLEQQLGVAYYRESDKFLGKPGICNIFSIKGGLNDGVSYIGSTWNVYKTYGNAFMAFSKLIAGKNYFEAGRFTIASIGPTYCPTGDPPGSSWSGQVTSIVIQIMQYYTGSKWSSNLQFSDNSEFVGIAKDLIMLLARAGYSYSTSAGIPNYDPFNHTVTGETTIDCTAYVSGVIKAYGLVHNKEALINIPRFSSDSMCTFANSVANGSTSGAAEFFQAVWVRNNRNMNHPDGSAPSVAELQEMMLPGDILVFYGGHRNNDFKYQGCCGRSGKGAHHAEIFEGQWRGSSCSIYSCGSAPKNTDGEPTWRSMSSGYNGNTRNTLFAILRLNTGR